MISVIIPVHNSSQYLDRTIAGIESQDYDKSQYEVIMVDNNSTDDSMEIISRHPWIKLLREPQQGSYAARNRGLDAALGEIIAFTDADCVPRSDWLSRIAEAMTRTTTGIVLGRRLASSSTMGLALLHDYQDTRDDFIFNGSDGDLYYGYTNNMAVRKSYFNGVHFKERLRGSDTAFVSQIVKRCSAECVHHDPEMQVTHLELTSAWVVFKKYFIYGRSQELIDHESNWRALTVGERLEVFGRTIKVHRFSHLRAAALLGLLLFGIGCWWAGSLSARIVK